MRYVDLQLCRERVFPFIHECLSAYEPSPDYEHEQKGMDELEKVLTFARDDHLYATFAEKAAYIICSIAGSQYFSNGNKRLGVSVLLYFLLLNEAEVELLDEAGYRGMLTEIFPRSRWESNPNIAHPHALFLYNLAITIGERKKWNAGGFDALKKNVGVLFAHLYHTA